MKFELRDHQEEAIAAIERQFASGVQRTLAVLATGAGKTMVYLWLANKWYKEGKRVLILAHLRELIHQPADRAADFFPELRKHMGIVMAELDESAEQVTIATIQTAYRTQRLADDYDYVILDECHHGTSTLYAKMFKKYHKAKWLGLTATPFRNDGDNLSRIFDSVAYRFPITTAIEKGILVPFEAYGFTLPVSIGGVTETMEGWDKNVLGSLLSADNAIEVVYTKWKEYCHDRQTICFTASVGQAYATANFFKDKGIRAEAVDGTTSKKRRDAILRLFRKGKIQVVCNCKVWTEGVDVPEASAALMVCPTKSDLSYVQKLGRVLRTFPGKTEAIILDFAPLEDRNIVMAGDILGVPRAEKAARAKAIKSGVMVAATQVDLEGVSVSIDPSELIVEALKYLRKGFLAWSIKDNIAVASISDSTMLVIEMPDVKRIGAAEALRAKHAGRAHNTSDTWNNDKERLYRHLLKFKLWTCKKGGRGWIAELAADPFATMEEASAHANSLVDAGYQPHLAKRRRAWRERSASEPQLNYMKMLKIEIPDNCNQGQAAQLISHELACNAVNRIRPELELKVLEG